MASDAFLIEWTTTVARRAVAPRHSHNLHGRSNIENQRLWEKKAVVLPGINRGGHHRLGDQSSLSLRYFSNQEAGLSLPASFLFEFLNIFMEFSPQQLLAEIEQRERIHNSFAEFCTYVLAPKGQRPARHHLAMIDHLERLERGEIDRLMIFCPPGMAKSTYAAVLFPAWWMIRNPATKVVGVSYGADLANRNSSEIKQIVTDFPEVLEFQFQKGKDRTENWGTTNRCEYKAIGTTGGLTGFRSHLTIMDDLVADQEAADSETERQRLAQYYGTVLKPRMTRGGRVPLNRGRIVLIMTRWHP